LNLNVKWLRCLRSVQRSDEQVRSLQFDLVSEDHRYSPMILFTFDAGILVLGIRGQTSQFFIKCKAVCRGPLMPW